MCQLIVTPDLFRVLGVPAYRGRTFTHAEVLPNAAPTVVLSHDTWKRAFAGDDALVGQAIQVDGVARTVVGVMPPGFDVHDAHLGVYLPAGLDPSNRTRRGNHYLHLVGRLKPDVSLAQARAELDTLLNAWPVGEGVDTPSPKNHRLRYDPLLDQLVGDVRPALWVLQAAVLAVLLIACANLVNLLLARSETRQREFAVRASLGAGRARLVREFIAGGVILKQNDQTRRTINLNKADTLLYIDSLLPNQTYRYQASSNQQQVSSNDLSVTTMDTTSHNFTWQTFEFGEHDASFLWDISIVDENNIWSVGEVYLKDSLGNTDPYLYNVAHWDGNNWSVRRVDVLFRGNIITPSLDGVFALSNNSIWLVGSLPIYGDGQNWHLFDLRTTLDPNISLS